MLIKGNVRINDNEDLEKEADVMGTRALQMQSNKLPPTNTAVQKERDEQREEARSKGAPDQDAKPRELEGKDHLNFRTWMEGIYSHSQAETMKSSKLPHPCPNQSPVSRAETGRAETTHRASQSLLKQWCKEKQSQRPGSITMKDPQGHHRQLRIGSKPAIYPQPPIQRQEDPVKGEAKMEKALAQQVNPEAMSARQARTLKYIADQTLSDQERIDKLPMSRDVKIIAYYNEVKRLEGKLKQLSDKKIVQGLYDAWKSIIPKGMAKIVPELVMIDAESEGAEGAFDPQNWKIEIKLMTPEEITIMYNGSLLELSATIYHEGRHVEQLWEDVFYRDRIRKQKPKTISQELRIDQTIITMILTADAPEEYSYGNSQVADFKKKDYDRFEKTRSRLVGVRKNVEQISYKLSMGTSLTKQEQKQLEKAKQLEEEYRRIPEEADAFAIEETYRQIYKSGAKI